MVFRETVLAGAFIIEMEPWRDDRGYFARGFCAREFRGQGLDMDIKQCNVSYNRLAGTLRGLHYQASPGEESKIVTCLRGQIYDVIVDLRPDSPTFGRWHAVRLGGEPSWGDTPSQALYIPKGFAHGFETLEDDTTVYYQMSEFHNPDLARGVRWDDPALGIRWPQVPPRVISERDASFPSLNPQVRP